MEKGKSDISHNNNFHIASYTGLLVIAIKLKGKENIFKFT